MYRLTIDTGTTNTRVTLWEEDHLISESVREIGVKDTAIYESNGRLKEAIRSAINEQLETNDLLLKDITTILASGMITSNLGLEEIKHIETPSNIRGLAAAMEKRYFPDIVDKEIWFIPGMKNKLSDVNMGNFEEMDMMRGEEVETIGLINRMNIHGPALIILPGSHTKFVSINEENTITGCLTTLTGELLSVITKNTIISNALHQSFATEFDQPYVLEGYKSSTSVGLTRSSFALRIMDQFMNVTVNEKANFLLGVILKDDVAAIKNSRALSISADSNVYIAGKGTMRDSLEAILEYDGFFKNVIPVDAMIQSGLAGYGSICIAKERRL